MQLWMIEQLTGGSSSGRIGVLYIFSWAYRRPRPMPLTFRIQFLLFFGFIVLQANGLSPGNADVLVGFDLPRHIYCRRGRQRSQDSKVAEPSRLRRARCPRSFEGRNRRERGRPARMK
jgi:hypothetical protein